MKISRKLNHRQEISLENVETLIYVYCLRLKKVYNNTHNVNLRTGEPILYR